MYGVIGEKLGHSFSKEIHESFNLYKYNLIELKKTELAEFIKTKNFDGLNVTIPYKQEVMKYLDVISPTALEIGAVNTIVKHLDRLYGYNTDYIGVIALIRYYKIKLDGKRVLILGTGGTSNTVEYVLKMFKVKSINKVSRHKQKDCITYDDLKYYKDTDVIINTTPCGMYPNDDCLIDLSIFTNLEVILDIVYNPINTKLVRMGRMRGIRSYSGLLMLVAQAVIACGLFKKDEEDYYEKSVNKFLSLLKEKTNIVLIGMPSSGKSTLAKLISPNLNKEVIEVDDLIEQELNMPIKDYLNKDTEKEFRKLETKIIDKISFDTNKIISCGGGVIINKENIDHLRRNGLIIFIDRPLELLEPTNSRPLANTKNSLNKLYSDRYQKYLDASDIVIKNDKDLGEVKKYLLEAIYENFSN